MRSTPSAKSPRVIYRHRRCLPSLRFHGLFPLRCILPGISSTYLTRLPTRFPVSLGAGAVAAGLALDPKGQFLYAADSANNKIASFNVAGGPLAAVGSFPAGTKPVAVTVDSTSTFVYSANQGSNDVSAFKTASGALTQVTGSPYLVQPTGSVGTPQPTFLTIDPSNTFLYVANAGSSSISA